MLEADFRRALHAQLARSLRESEERLRRVFDAIPPEAEGLTLMVFPEQEGEGAFAVRALVDGPGSFQLQKALGDDAELFGVVHTADGLEPPVPLVDPFATDFEVNDVVVDVAAAWLRELWQSLGPPTRSISVSIDGADGYGPTTPIALARKQG